MKNAVTSDAMTKETKNMSRSYEIVFHRMIPQSGYPARMRLYCQCMFPLPMRLANSVLLYLGFALLVCRINDWTVDLISGWSALAIWNLLALAFILRLMDELKDRDIDKRLFADRPVPSGAVFESDIRLTLAGVTGMYIAINLMSLSTEWIAVASLAYAYLMFAYFFIPRLLRRYLLLNLATHNLSVPLFLIMVTALVAAQHHAALKSMARGETLLAVGMFWSLVLAWELSRKIRSREEENEYVTYSQIFGRVPAVFITLAVQSVAAWLGLRFALMYQFAPVAVVILGVGYAAVFFAAIRFIVAPSPRTSRLRPFSEAYTVLVFLAIIVDHALRTIGV